MSDRCPALPAVVKSIQVTDDLMERTDVRRSESGRGHVA